MRPSSCSSGAGTHTLMVLVHLDHKVGQIHRQVWRTRWNLTSERRTGALMTP